MRSEKKLFFIPLFLLLIFLLGTIVRWLWNAVLPEVTNAKPLNYWQALGLLALCRILFGRFDFKRGRDRRQFKRDFRERFRNMSDEEKRRFQEEWKRRCRF
ncbi:MULTISPECIES: hypothetical protein [Chitinophagaceae]